MSKASKNQRSGPKAVQARPLCAAGHERIPVMVCSRGPRGRMYLMCECDGFKPIMK